MHVALYKNKFPPSQPSFPRCPSSAPVTSYPTCNNQYLTSVVFLLYIEQSLKFGDQYPLIVTDVRSIEFFQRVDTLPRNHRVKRVLFFQVSTVHWLIWTFDLDCNRGLAFLTYRNLFVVAFDR